jgi:hypothetical protein
MPFTSQTDLVSGHLVKFGLNHSSLDENDEDLEAKIARSLLCEGSGNAIVTTAVNDFINRTGTQYGNNPNQTNYLSSIFDNENIQIELNPEVSYRNMAIVANYVNNEDETEYGESINSVVINSNNTQNVTSKVLDDSSAYANATAKFTITDPYYLAPEFGNDGYICTFDVSSNPTIRSKFITTRNVNTNDAHFNNQGSITAGDYVSWNTDGNCGSYFVNGTVSFEDGTGKPLSNLYASDASLNILAQNFTFSLRTDDSDAVPEFGRYFATYTTGSGSQSNVDISYNGNKTLVVTTDTASWTAFESNLDTTVDTQPLPDVGGILVNDVGNWVLPSGISSDGFTVRIESTEFTSTLSLVNNAVNTPLTFNVSSMNLSPKSMYILEESMDACANITSATSTTTIGNSTLINPEINDIIYTNSLVITNGGLSLDQTPDVVSNYIQLLDGTEMLGVNDYNTNGEITVYPSARVSSSTDDESLFPRASRTDVSETYPILNNLAVQYTSDDSGYVYSVGDISGADLTDASGVTYEISTLTGQTGTEDACGNFTNIIGYLNNAVAIVKDTNSTIDRSAISFSANTNTYYSNQLSIVDLTCQKKWSESKVYDSTDAVIPNVTVDITESNMPSDFNVKDIRLKLEARPLSDLSLSLLDASWSITSPDAFLKSSAGKIGVIDDSVIVDLLLGVDQSTTRSLDIVLKPNVASVEASKFTKFHNQIEITYGGATQITYDDEFEIVETTVPGVPDKTPHADELITGYTHLPANTKLYKRSYTESFKVKIPFRFGNYTNLFLTTPTITQKVEYYVLTDDTNSNADLPRYSLRSVRDASEAVINAIITGVGSHTSPEWSTTVSFKNNDFRTHHITVQKLLGSGDWTDQALTNNAHVDADFWYNTQSTLATDGIGTFKVSFTLSPELITMDKEYLYVDMELEKGTTSFTLTGKTFTQLEVDNLGTVDLNLFDLTNTTGTDITGTLTYSNDNDASPNTQADTTLSGGGYTFSIQGNLYLSIRVIACPNGMFKCIKTGGDTAETTYHYIQNIDTEDSLILTGSGVYGYGDLRSARRGTSTAKWSLNNSAISASYYDSNSFTTERLTSLNQEFIPDEGRRGFKTTVLRGLKPDTTTIYRTPSTYVFNLAGLDVSGDLYNGIDISESIHNIAFASNENILSMYNEATTTLSYNINLTYTFYKIFDKARNGVDGTTSYVPSYTALLSERAQLNIISTTLNTNNFYYQILYTSTSALIFYRHPNIDADNYTTNSSGYLQNGEAFTIDQLTDPSANNLVGNILNVSYYGTNIATFQCQFCIAPPYLQFTAIDPASVDSLPFDSTQITPVERYLEVDNTSNNYNPFSAHESINNINFVQNSTKSYLNYFYASTNPVVMNIDNYEIAVELANGLESDETVGIYTSFYPSTTISTLTPVSTDNVQIDFSNNKLIINMAQQKLFQTFFTFNDLSFSEFNLETEIGSIFISDPNDGSYDGSAEVLLEFQSGDSTRLDLYSIETIKSAGANVEAVFEKYSSSAGIDNAFLNSILANGLAIPWDSRFTKTISVSKNNSDALTSTKVTFNKLLESLSAASTSSQFTSWVLDETDRDPDLPLLPRLAFIPNTSAGANSLKKFLTLSKQIPRSVLMLQLEDHQRLVDTHQFPKYRVLFSGAVQTQVSHIEPAVIRYAGQDEIYTVGAQIDQNYPTLTRK